MTESYSTRFYVDGFKISQIIFILMTLGAERNVTGLVASAVGTTTKRVPGEGYAPYPRSNR